LDPLTFLELARGAAKSPECGDARSGRAVAGWLLGKS
jgi:hypothetical protein